TTSFYIIIYPNFLFLPWPQPQNIDLEIRHAFLGRFILDWAPTKGVKAVTRRRSVRDYLPPRSLHCVSVRQSHASYSLVLSTARNHIS
ncbi:hypothetical protein IGI04_041894, partial [Brassica rapa subsp. trilocularis]